MRNLLCFLALFAFPACVFSQDDADPYQDAVKAGAKYLKGAHAPNAFYRGGSHGVGTACLGGLALLEAGGKPEDAEITFIANYIRNQALSTNGTYEVALTVMFLDRLGLQSDIPLLQFMGIRLLSGQCRDGSWSYSCNITLNANEERRLRGLLVREAKLVAGPPVAPKVDAPPVPDKPKPIPRDDLPKDPTMEPVKPKETPIKPKDDPKKTETPKADPPKDSIPKLHEEAVRYARLITEKNNGLLGMGGDHSNTQFATVALWCARRNGVPVDNAILLLDKHYRGCQNEDGSWGYTARGGGSPAMTCAGLIALAMSYGLKEAALKSKPDGAKGEINLGIEKDKAIEAGLKYLGTNINKGAQLNDRMVRGKKRFQPNDTNENLYLLWSIERVGVLLGLNTIGNIDWYAWGADALIATQQRDGSWTSSFHGGNAGDVSTPLAVLFLSRANLTGDLSRALKGQVKDPGTATLVGGGDISKLIPGGGKTDPKVPPKTDPTKPDPKTDPTKPDPIKPVVRPDDDFTKKVDRLVLTVTSAKGDEVAELLTRYADTKGAEYTEALARLAAQLTGTNQSAARDSLARRLTRMTVGTLLEMLRDSDGEVRRAAALACGSKNDKACVPELIRLLGDPDVKIVQNARNSLKIITKVDHGPEENANATERTKALLAWRQWWEKNK